MPAVPFVPSRQFSYSLRQSCSVYFEGSQYYEGFTLLHSILTAGASQPNAPPPLLPTTSYLELAATLVVYPPYTSRGDTDRRRAADKALTYLRDVIRIVGPVNAGLREAFQVSSARVAVARARAARTRRRRGAAPSPGPDSAASSADEWDAEEEAQLQVALVNEESVFKQRESFWLIVGWAFNTAVRWPRRWERWALWLEMMADVLAEDFKARLAMVEGLEVRERMEVLAREALVMQYLADCQGRGGKRRVLGAVLADGGEKAAREFGPVWKDETKGLKRKDVEEQALLASRNRINLDEDEWGDYGVEVDEVATESDEEDDAGKTEEHDFGGAESMRLRQRFIHLLTNVAWALPKHFATIEHLFDVLTELLRPLPLPTFSRFLATSLFDPVTQISLLTNLLLPFLATPPKRPDIFNVTQDDLITWYLPHAANGVGTVENAKMSLLIEHLLLNMRSAKRLRADAALSEAIERGIRARAGRAIGDARRKDKGRSAEEREARSWLDMSAERIGMVIASLGAYGDEVAAAKQGNNDDGGAPFFSSQLSDWTEVDSDGQGDVTVLRHATVS